jgi:hypothetical protein
MVKDLFPKVKVGSLSPPTCKFEHLDTLMACLAYEVFLMLKLECLG